jgi:hypothetical protein
VDSGHNSASDNTGGSVGISTGNTVVELDVTNLVNNNRAEVSGCDTCDGDTDVLIQGNGTSSDNDVNLGLSNTVWVDQSNVADIENDFDVDTDTGWNHADDNTSTDEVAIQTGSARVELSAATLANSNAALVGGGTGDGRNLSVQILGNGSDTDNTVNLGMDDSIVVWQDNVANIENDFDIDGDTGHNHADDNTGGDVLVGTGSFVALATVDNMANFNAANVDCDCLMDVTAKVSGNGTESDSDINASLGGTVFVDQANSCGGFLMPSLFDFDFFNNDCIENDINIDGDSGWNTLDDNTGDPGVDPMTQTGSVGTAIDVDNSSGVNIYGASLPTMSLNWNMGNVWSSVLGMWQ